MGKRDRKHASPAAPATSTPVLPAWLWPAAILATLWGLFALNRFYVFQPFSHLIILDSLFPANAGLIPTISALIDYFSGLFWALCVWLSAFFLGRLVLFKFMDTWASALEKLVIAAGVGYGLLAYLTFAVGLLGGLYSSGIQFAILILAGAGGVWFWRPVERALLKEAGSALKQIFFGSGLQFLLTVMLVFVFATAFVMAFVPELFYDALVYHLGAPNFYLTEHRLAPLDLMTAKFPFTIQMLNVIGLGLKNEIVTKLTHQSMMWVLAMGMLSIGLRFGRPVWGLLGAIAFCSIPTAQMNVWTSGVDLGVSLFGYLAAMAFFLAMRSREDQNRWWVLSALFSGLTSASKYTASYVPVVIILSFVIISVKRRESIAAIVKWVVVYGLISAAVLLPWWIKNALEVGNPVYPFLTKYLGGVELESWRYAALRGENKGLTPKNIQGVLTLLWDLSIKERSSLSFQGPLLLMLAPWSIAALIKNKAQSIKPFVIYGALFLIIGLLMTRLTRYLLPGITVLALLAAYGTDDFLKNAGKGIKYLALAVFVGGYFYQMCWAYMTIGMSSTPLNVLLGRESRFQFSSYYHNGMQPNPPLEMYAYIEKSLPAGSRVLLVGEEKAYPLKFPHLYSGVYDNGPLIRATRESATPQEMTQKLKALGITHVMVNLFESYRIGGYGIFGWTPKEFGLFCAWWESHLKLTNVIYTPAGKDKNPLVLLEITAEPVGANSPPMQNILGPVYEYANFERMGIISNEQKREFYEELYKSWPNVIFINQRLRELRQK